MGQTTPPPPQVVVVRQGHSGCFWFLVFLLIVVLVIGIVVFLAAMGLFGAIAGLFAEPRSSGPTSVLSRLPAPLASAAEPTAEDRTRTAAPSLMAEVQDHADQVRTEGAAQAAD
jgi:hypothetical protein